MTRGILWTLGGLVAVETLSKVVRPSIHSSYFLGKSCAEVMSGLGQSVRFTPCTLIAIVRLVCAGVQICLMCYLRHALPDLKHHEENSTELGFQRLEEVMIVICGFLVLQSSVVCCLAFFSPIDLVRRRSLCICRCFLRDLSSGLRELKHSLFGRRELDGENLFLERRHRVRWKIRAGLTWYVHRHRHRRFDAADARVNDDACGLPAYWFYSVEELVLMVRRPLSSRRDIMMALESLFRLSRKRKVCYKCRPADSDETSCFSDLPEISRCTHDVDLGRDFAQAEGYSAMLWVLKCWPSDSHEAELAASILAGFFAGLPVLPWQPDRNSADKDFILDMLRNENFRNYTKELLCLLLRLLSPYATESQGDQKLQVQEAAASAISALALAASDINALVNCPVRLHLLENLAHSPNSPAMRGYVTRLSCAFTTICPVGWHLDKDWPTKFDDAFHAWVEDVKEFLCDQATVEILLACAKNDASSSIVAECIRTLSWLWSRRTIYWHRHDKRMKDDFPPPLGEIPRLHREANVRDLQNLLSLCVDRPESLSPLLRLHLAKIFISQQIQDVYTEVAEVLLECLTALTDWRFELRTREEEWFATETIESIRDLVHDLQQQCKPQHDLKREICRSHRAVRCLQSVLVRPIQESVEDRHGRLVDSMSRCTAAAAGLLADLLEVPNSCEEGLLPSDRSEETLHGQPVPDTEIGVNRINTVYSPGESSANASGRDAGGAVGVGAREYSTRPSAAERGEAAAARAEEQQLANRLSSQPRRTRHQLRVPQLRRVGVGVPMVSVLQGNPGVDGKFLMSFFASLRKILRMRNSESLRLGSESDAVEAAGNGGTGFAIRFRRCGILLRRLFARLGLIFWESLGNPAWVPAICLFEDLEGSLTVTGEPRNTIQLLERGLNALLEERNVIRLIHQVLSSYPHRLDARLVTAFIPPMVDVLAGPFPRLDKRLELGELETSANKSMADGVIKVLTLIIPRIAEVRGDPTPQESNADPSLPSIDKLKKATAKLEVWARPKAVTDVAIEELLTAIH
ncbi:hypothetical protein CBR_g55428 [Chara braunii]|uniref:Uncharacterized protein n=1 Tax=Chara braunii TaxID=69332 RepID=A0A388K7P5_CHABU|nr:hypothetical protein CBR_g55428 [Chara braunii]|eukprot:GBG66085.1 hypothetical protein CBR_g55428 [Chara braunii]